MRWHGARWKIAVGVLLFRGLESTFVVGNVRKVPHGGWVTLLIAAIMYTLMRIWQLGSQIIAAKRAREEGSLEGFLDELHSGDARLVRVPGSAIFPNGSSTTAPLALRATVGRLHVLEESVVIVSAESVNSPHVAPASTSVSTIWARALTVSRS